MTYSARHLRDIPESISHQLIRDAVAGKLVLYAGAGLSRSAPSRGPMGDAVANRLLVHVADALGRSTGDLNGATLEELTELVEKEVPEKLPQLKDAAARSFPFADMRPNFGHLAVALLIRENLATVLSVNWDTAIEAASRKLDQPLVVLASQGDVLTAASSSVVLYKLHGCATKPDTLVLTKSEVNAPATWALSRAQAALTNGTVAFIGLGTLGEYVRLPIETVLAEFSQYSSRIRVVGPGPGLGETWTAVLGDRTAESHIDATADQFLEELLAALLREALSGVLTLISTLLENEVWGTEAQDGFVQLKAALADTTVESAMRWWSDGASARGSNPFLFDQSGRFALLTACLIIARDQGSARCVGRGSDFTVHSGSRCIELIGAGGRHISEITRSARDRIDSRLEEGLHPSGDPIVVVVTDAIGSFPSAQASMDIAAYSAEAFDITAAAEDIELSFIDAADGRRGVTS